MLHRLIAIAIAVAIAVAGACAGGGRRPSRAAGDPRLARASIHHRIVVLGDQFQSEKLFIHKVNQLVGAVFKKDKVFKEHAGAFEIQQAPVLTPELAGPAGSSRFDLRYNGQPAKCYFTEGANTTRSLLQAAEAFKPYDTLVVIANIPHQAGCAMDERIYLGSEQNWITTAHELGHRLGLHDEWAVEGAAHPHFEFDEAAAASNCSACADRPWWTAHVAANATPVEGCAMRGQGLWHFQPLCRMSRATDKPFCPACTVLLSRRLNNEGELRPACRPPGTPSPAQPSASGSPSSQSVASAVEETYTQLSVTVHANDGLRIEQASEVRGVVRPKSETSPYIYAVKLADDEEWLYGESLPSDLFTQRVYRPAPNRDGHDVRPVASSLVTLRIVDVTKEQLQDAKNLQVEVYRVLKPREVLIQQATSRGARGGMAPRIEEWMANQTLERVARGAGLQSQVR